MNNRDGSTNRQTGQPMNGEHFMSSFRSALSSLDNAQGGGRPATRTQDPYSPSVMDIMPYARGGGEYTGFRPEGLLSLAFGMPVAPYSDQSLDGVEYEDESHMEQGRDYMRMGYSRTVYGQRPSRSSVQMMMGRGGVGFRTLRSSRLRSGGGMIGMPEAALLGILGAGILGISRGESCGNPLCPLHGTLEGGGHGHGHRHQGFHGSDDDHYEGPIIEELSDDEDHAGDHKPMLALPAPEDDANKRGGEKRQTTKNKNAECGRIEVVRNENYDDRKSNESFSSETGKIKFETDFESDNIGSKPEVNPRLRKMTQELGGHDNREMIDNKDRDVIDYKIIIPMSASNVSKGGFSLKTSKIQYNQESSDTEGLTETQRPQSPVFMFDEVDEEETPTQPIEMTSEDQHVTSIVDKTSMSAVPNTEKAGKDQTVTKEEAIEKFESLHFEENYFSNETGGSSIFSEDKHLKRKEQVLNDNNFHDNNEVPLSSGAESSVQSEQPELRTNSTKLDTEDDQRRKNLKRKYQLNKDETETMNHCVEPLPLQLNENGTDIFHSISDSVGRESSPIQSDKFEFENTNEMLGIEHEEKTAKQLEEISRSESQESVNNDKRYSFDENDQLKQSTDYQNPSGISQEGNRRDTGFDASAIDTFPQNLKGNISSQNKQTVEQKGNPAKVSSKQTFYKMIQSRLPDKVSKEDLDRTMGRHAELEDKIKEFDDLANSFNNPVTNTRPKQVKQKNAKPGTLSKTHIQKDTPSCQTKPAGPDADKTQSLNLDNRNFKFIENSKGIRKPLHQHSQNREPENEASWCERCQKVHIRCGCCDRVLQTLCGNCFKCNSEFAHMVNRNATPPGENLTQRQSLFKNNSELNSTHNTTSPHSTHKRRPNNEMIAHSKEEATVGDSSFAAHPLFHEDRTPPKKPMRNKNASQGPSPIRIPNFTTKPKQNIPTSAGRQHSSSSGYYNDSYYQRQSSSTDRLSKLGEVILDEGLVVKDVYPDGNCFFAAIVDQLRVRGEFYYTAKSLRNAAVNYLRAHPNQDDGTPLLEFVFDHDGTTWEDYLTRLRRDGEWADHIIISAISSVLRRRIVIHSIRRSDQSINKTIMEPDCIAKLNDKEPNTKTKTDGEDDLDEPTKDGDADVETRTEDSIDVEELHEDLLLGHIPEAHYVSLRFVDWEERLFKDLREKKDRPHTVLTEYGKRKAADGESRSVKALLTDAPTIHLDFLISYIYTSDFFINFNCISTVKGHMHPIFPFDGLYSARPSGKSLTKVLDKIENQTHFSEERRHESEQNESKQRSMTMESTDDGYTMKALCIPADTYVRENNREKMRATYLHCDRETSPIGYTKLRPSVERLWPNKLVLNDNKQYLKQLVYHGKRNIIDTTVAFRSDLPEEAVEWFDRERGFKWPSEEFIEEMKGSCTCLVTSVVSSQNTVQDTSNIEWKFSFDLMEIELIKDEVTKYQRKAFAVFQQMIQLLLPAGPIQYYHLKQVFFFCCETRHPDDWKFDPIACIIALVEKLIYDLNNLFLPYYFCSDFNAIAELTREELLPSVETLETIRVFPFVALYLTLEKQNLSVFYSHVLDDMIEDIQRYVLDEDSRRSMNECFEPLAVRGVSDRASSRYFKSALKASRSAVLHLEKLGGHASSITLHDFLSLVLFSTADRYRWMFALYLDQTLDTSFVKTVTDLAKPTVSLFELFGPQLKDSLKTYGDDDIRVPQSLTETAQLMTFVLDMVSLFKEDIGLDQPEVGPCLQYFSDRHFNDVVEYVKVCPETEKSVIVSQMEVFINLIKIDYYRMRLQFSTMQIVEIKKLIKDMSLD